MKKEWYKEYLEYHFHKAKLRESLYERDFLYLDKEVKINPEFKKLMETPITELDSNWSFSFAGEDWEFFKSVKDNSYYNFIKYLTGRFDKYKTLVSENSSEEPLGWMVYEINGDIACNIKFGSFSNDTNKNLELLQDVRKEFLKLIDRYFLVEWIACEKNTKVFNLYKKIVDKYKGIDRIIEGESHQFIVSKFYELESSKNLFKD